MATTSEQPSSSRPGDGVLSLMAGASLISFSAVCVKLAHVGPTMAGFYRMFFGGLVLAGLLLAQGVKLRVPRRDLGLSLACAFFFALDLTFWHRAIHYVGPGLGTILSNFQVFFLAGIGALFFGERMGWRLMMAIPLALSGLFLLVRPDRAGLPPDYLPGVGFGLLTALVYASYLLTLRRLQGGLDADRVRANMVIISLACAAMLAPGAWLMGESFAIPDAQSWAALLGYGLVGQVLGWVFISRGLPRTPAARAGLILLLQPTLSFVWDMLFFARPTTPVEMVGAAGALAAIYLGTTSRG